MPDLASTYFYLFVFEEAHRYETLIQVVLFIQVSTFIVISIFAIWSISHPWLEVRPWLVPLH